MPHLLSASTGSNWLLCFCVFLMHRKTLPLLMIFNVFKMSFHRFYDEYLSQRTTKPTIRCTTIVCCYSSITKTCLYNSDPLKPHFYIVKLGFTGVYIIFLISAQNIYCGYSLEPPRRGPKSMFLSRNKKNNVYPCKP